MRKRAHVSGLTISNGNFQSSSLSWASAESDTGQHPKMSDCCSKCNAVGRNSPRAGRRRSADIHSKSGQTSVPDAIFFMSVPVIGREIPRFARTFQLLANTLGEADSLLPFSGRPLSSRTSAPRTLSFADCERLEALRTESRSLADRLRRVSPSSRGFDPPPASGKRRRTAGYLRGRGIPAFCNDHARKDSCADPHRRFGKGVIGATTDDQYTT